MIILSHRGYWKRPEEKNTKKAFNRSFDSGFGTETDVRDLGGRLVISHDMPLCDELDFSEFLKLINDKSLPLALNIKSDGLTNMLVSLILEYEIKDYFVFDMSVPDMKSYIIAKVPVFTRMSEFEREPVFFEKAAGVWLDSFESDWYDNLLIETIIKKNKRVCIVSPELHKRDHLPLWQQLLPLAERKLLMLCTDFPKEAIQFFGMKNEN